jgi:peptidoglycan L-alanyl-D-glutamate endopeptidase CwlK
MAIKRHTNTPDCALCSQKLTQVDSVLQEFTRKFRSKNLNAHISWGYRGKEDQEKFLKLGTTKAKFGESPHNFGLALDFFTIASTGQADWSKEFFENILAPAAKEADLEWGGSWKSLKDMPHVEIKNWKSKIPTK